MGTKKIGLGRMHKLIEMLKRDLNLSGSTIRGAKIEASSFQFATPPVVLDDDSTLAAGLQADSSVLHKYNDGLLLHVHPIGSNQDTLVPVAATTGMDYTYDNDDNSGSQWVTKREVHKVNLDFDYFKVGTSEPFFMEMKFSIGDVSYTDDCVFGFRKVEDFTAAVDDYNDMAGFNIVEGKVNVESIRNNNATTSSHVHNWADGETHTVAVLVDKNGHVTYEYDGALITGSHPSRASASFDTDEEVTPFGYHIQKGNTDPTIIYQSLSFGLQRNR